MWGYRLLYIQKLFIATEAAGHWSFGCSQWVHCATTALNLFVTKGGGGKKLHIAPFLESDINGSIYEPPGRSRQGRERVKRLRLPDNPPPLKALQKDVTCVR